MVMQDINAELREELRFNEQRRLEEWNAKENSQPRAANSQRRPTGSASGSAASTAKKPAAAKPDQNPASKLTVPSHPVVQAPTQPALQAGVVPAAAEPSPQHSASAYDDEDSEEEREGQFSQQGSPAAAVSEQAPWQMHLPLQANQAQLAYQTSGPLAQQLSAQQSYAALHAFDSYPELRGYQQAATQARAQYQQPGSIHQAGVHPEAKREILGKAAPEQASGRPLHAVDADRYGDSVVRSSAGGFVWQPMHPDDRHSISTAAPDASAMFQPLQASSSGFFHSALPDTGDRHEFRDSSHQNAKHDGRFSVSMQQAQQAQDKSAVQQNPGSSISWQDMQQGSDCWSTAAPLDDEHDTYAVSTNGQQEWALMSNSLPANRQRPEDSLPFMTAGQSAVNIWNQSGDDHAAAHSSFAPDRMHSSRHKPDAQSASKDALWQSAGVQPVRRQLSAHASQDMLQSQAESGSNDVHQAAAAQLLTAQSSMQVGVRTSRHL